MTDSVKPRPVRLNRQQRREQLLDAARLVFAQQGFHAAAMDDIAEDAGVSKPVLYRHFPSKLALYQALLEESATSLVDLVSDAINSTDDNALRVTRAVSAYFDFVSDKDQAFRLIFESDLRDEPAVAQVVSSATDACITAVATTIAADTSLTDEQARLLAAGMVGLSQVSAQFWLSENSGITQEAAVELLSGLAWRGIANFPRPSDQ